jgi:Tfp pilus assembly protein PilN
MTRLHQEIARSITFYRSEHGGAQPVRVLLAGNTASFPYMREFFQEKLQMEVEYFNPLQNVSVAPSLNVEHIGRIAHTLGELVGLALRSAVSCPMELNLRPPSVTRAEQQAKQRPYYIAAGVTLLATLAGWWLYFDKSATLTQRKADELTGRAESLKPIDNKIKQLRDELKREQDGLEPLLKAVHERNYWTSVINDLNSRLPADYIWITALELPTRDELGKIQADAESAAPPRRQGGKKEESEGPAITMTIRGLYLSRDAGNAKSTAIVDEYLANLAESPYVKVPDPSKIGRAADDTQQWAFDFAVPLELKNPISLK